MSVTTSKALLFLAGGVAAAAVVAYGAGAFDRLLERPPETIAALPEAGQADQKEARLPGAEAPTAAKPPPAEPPASEAAPAAAPQPAGPAAAGPEGASEPPVVPPSFDVVRIEGDGSIVVAGKAAPSAAVDLLVGSNVIGSTTAGADGDFAVVLDDPLKPGDYQIVLRATAPDNVVAMSVETAVVSVPETPDGQVLALVEEPGKPSQMITVPQPQAPAAAAKPPEADAPPAPEAPPAAEPKPGGEMQAALPQEVQPAAPAPAPPAAGPAVRVDAVEIDGRRIFVAGSAEPGRTVRGYANEILLGDAKASPDGTYLIEAERDLPVGDYIIRVDALEPDGVKVAARAAVPFEREPGETIAAVAPQAPPATMPPGAEAPAATASAPEAPAAAQAPAPTGSASETPAAVTETPSAEPSASASGSSAQATAPEAPAAATGTASPAAEAPAALAEAPATEPPATATQPGATAEAEGPGSGQPTAPEKAASPPAVAEAPASETPPAGGTPSTQAPASGEATKPAAEPPGTDVAAAPGAESDLPAPPPAGVDEVLAPKLQSVDSAVIIRRGDTLWRISRRVYGRGIRYSTIYLANEDQIEDPDRIWPGQVFKVPEKSTDGKAEADYSTLGDRLTTVPKEDGQTTDPAEAQQ